MYGRKTDIFIDEDLLAAVQERQDARFNNFLETNKEIHSPVFGWLYEERENDIRQLRIALALALEELKKFESKPPFWQFWKK